MRLRLLQRAVPVVVLIIMGIAGRLCARDLPAGWVEIKSAEGRFSAWFPEEPKQMTQTAKTAQGPIDVHAYEIMTKAGCDYTLTWSDYTEEMMRNRTAGMILVGIEKGYAKNGKKVVSSKAITLGDHLGREMEVDYGAGVIHRVRAIVAGRRLYNMMTFVPADKRKDAAEQEFLDSFSLVETHHFPARGFRVEATTSGRWKRVEAGMAKRVIQWGILEEGKPGLRAIVTVEAAKGKYKTAKETAEALAKDWGGSIAPDEVSLDAEKGLRVVGNIQSDDLQPREAVVASHDGYLYLVMGGSVKGESCHEKLEEVVKGWKWEKLAEPSEHLDLREVPVPLGKRVSVIFPRDMHIVKDAKPEPGRVLEISLYSMPEDRTVFNAYIQIAPLGEGKTMEAVKDDFLEKLKSSEAAEKTAAWRQVSQGRVMTQATLSKMMNKQTGIEGRVAWAMVDMGGSDVVLINFGIFTEDAEARKRLEEVAEKMVKALVVAEK